MWLLSPQEKSNKAFFFALKRQEMKDIDYSVYTIEWVINKSLIFVML